MPVSYSAVVFLMLLNLIVKNVGKFKKIAVINLSKCVRTNQVSRFFPQSCFIYLMEI